MPENKVQITIEAIDKAKGALDDVAKGLKGIQDETKKTGQESQGLTGILASLKSNWIGLSIGINQALEVISKIRQAGTAIYDFAKEGQKVVLVETAFKQTAASVGADADAMIGRLKSATKGVMDDTDLMRSATEMMLAGVKPDRVEKLTEAMAKLAPYAGMTLPEGMQRLGTALETGNARAIKSMTGYIDLGHELDVYAQKLGRTADQLTDQARVQATGEIILARLNQKTKDFTGTLDLGINTFLRFETAWKNMIEDMQKGVGPISDLVQWMTKLIEKVNEYTEKNKSFWEEPRARKRFEESEAGKAIGFKADMTIFNFSKSNERAFEQWYATEKRMKEYQLSAESQDAARAAGKKQQGESPFRKISELQERQNELEVLQSINDEETKRILSLDKQMAIKRMGTPGITDEQIAAIKENEITKITNEFAAKRLNLQAAILKEQGFTVEALESQKEAELTLTTNAKDRFDLTKKWNLEIAKAISEREEKRLAAAPDVGAAFGAGWGKEDSDFYKETMIGVTTAQGMMMDEIGRRESELQEKRKIDQEEINLLRAQGYTAESDHLESLAKIVDLTDELNIIGGKISATEGVEQDHWINIYALKEQNLEATKRTLAVQEKMTEAVAEFYTKYKELTGVVLPGMESALTALIDKQTAAYKGILSEEDIEKMRAGLMMRMRIEAGTAGEKESFLYGWKQQEIEWGNTSKNMVQTARDSAEAMRQGFDDGFFTVMTGRLKDLQQVAAAFLNNLARAISRNLANEMSSGTLSLLGSIFGLGAGSGAVAGAGSVAGTSWSYETAGVFHSGGMVPEGGRWTIVPRLHSGLAPDEYPAILQKGERVLSRKEVAAERGGNQTLTIDARTNITGPFGNELSEEIEETIAAIVVRKMRDFSS